MQKYCSIKMKILLFGAIFLVFALMVSSARAAAIKGGFAVSGRSSSEVAAEPGSGEPIKNVAFDLDKFLAELSDDDWDEIMALIDEILEAPVVENVERHEILSEGDGMSHTDSKRALEAFVGSNTKSLKKGERVALVGFGSFSVTKRSVRTGRHPQTGKKTRIPDKKVVKFKAGSELAKKVP